MYFHESVITECIISIISCSFTNLLFWMFLRNLETSNLKCSVHWTLSQYQNTIQTFWEGTKKVQSEVINPQYFKANKVPTGVFNCAPTFHVCLPLILNPNSPKFNIIKPIPHDTLFQIFRMKGHNILLSVDGMDKNVIKIKPPMVFSEQNADEVVSTLDRVLATLEGSPICQDLTK